MAIMKKQLLKQAVEAIGANAIEEINDIPEGIMDALEQYECEGESDSVTIKLVIAFKDTPNTESEASSE